MQQVLNGIAYRQIGTGNPDITALACDTADIVPGCLFFCLSGSKNDGHDFFRKAIGDGAAAVVCERPLDTQAVQFVVADSRAAMSLAARNFYGRAADKLKLVFVCGTNGKTSVTYLLDAIFSRAGYRTGVIGTNGVYFGGRKHACNLTTPDPIEMHKWLWQMYLNKVQIVFAEASAHAIALRKLLGMHADVAVFTNFSQDHLDYFKTMDNYKAVKKSLFCPQYVTNAVVNIDDEVGREIVSEFSPVLTVSTEQTADVRAENIVLRSGGSTFTVDACGSKAVFDTQLAGKFNVYNILSAVGVATVYGIDIATCAAAIDGVTCIDGRNQTVVTDDGVRIVVDFAHTPDGLDNILSHLRQTTEGKLIVVFGCGGNRDKYKRPLMGRSVSRFADFAVVTNDNPRYEEPTAIVADIKPGLTCNYKIVLNRAQATKEALDMARRGDTVAILGKGAEIYQEIKGKRIYYNDAEVVARLTTPQR